MKVELQRIRHRYPYEKQDIFEDVSFVCENLQKIGVLAESQSGKTTLVRIAAGLLSPTDGTVRYDGIDRVKLKAKDCSVGILFADFALPPKLTVKEQILFPLKVRKMPKREREIEAERILTEQGLLQVSSLRTAEADVRVRFRTALARLSAVPRAFVLVDDVWKTFGERAAEAEEELQNYFAKYPATVLLVSSRAERLAQADGWVLLQNGKSTITSFEALREAEQQENWNLSDKLWKEGEQNGTESGK